MDGNGRWALNKKLDRFKGHEKGVKVVKEITESCLNLGVNFLTLYTFSNENWNRPPSEVLSLMNLFRKTLVKEISLIKDNDIKFKVIGDKSKLDLLTRKKIDSLEKETKDNKKMQLTLALSYGSRQEIVSSINKLLKNKKNKISMEDFSNSLYTSKIPDPELFIRTGYEKRLSNFLLWQIAYSEIFFIDEYWPNFNKEMLKKIIDQYNSRERRYGKLD
jgi:undecaprenyl diphosphate synthase